MIRVIVVDDQNLVRQGIRSVLSLLPQISVVAEAAHGKQALELVVEHEPDVVLLDLRMPRYDGIWFLRAMSEVGREVPTLVLTTFDDEELVLEALRCGAAGYLLKDVSLDTLREGIESLAAGRTFLQPALTQTILAGLGTTTRSAPPGPARLTSRERDILQLMANGHSNRDIARALVLAEGTVKNHVSSILMKLGTGDRTKAVLRALHEGLLG